MEDKGRRWWKKRKMTPGGGGRLGTHAYWVTVGLAVVNSSWGAVYLLWCAHLCTHTHTLTPVQTAAEGRRVAHKAATLFDFMPPSSSAWNLICLVWQWHLCRFTFYTISSSNATRWSVISYLTLRGCFSAACDQHPSLFPNRFVPAH